MAGATPETETPQEKEGMEVVESQAAQETPATEKGTSVTSEEPKEKTAEKQSKKPKTKKRRSAAPLYADVGDRATLLR